MVPLASRSRSLAAPAHGRRPKKDARKNTLRDDVLHCAESVTETLRIWDINNRSAALLAGLSVERRPCISQYLNRARAFQRQILFPIVVMPYGPKLSYLPDFEGRSALYRRLKPKDLEIRALTVWPNEDFSSPLECALQIHSIEDTISKGWFYDALSYYWGSANDLEQVLVHGSDEGRPTPSFEVAVTKNLTSALRHLRKIATTAEQPLVMWTDALCINQRDARERIEQVATMDCIFHFSRRIFVWLSDRNCNTMAAKGLNYIANMCDRFSVLDSDSSRQGEQIARYMADQDWNISDLIDAIEALTDLPYWRRGWILQEVSSSDKPKLLVLEEGICTFVHFRTFADVLTATCFYAMTQGLHPLHRRVLVNASTTCFPILAASEMHLYVSKYARINPFLSHRPLYIRTFDKRLDKFLAIKVWQTSDPRDHVFVLGGIHPAFADLNAGYHDTVERVFTVGTMALLFEGTWSRLCWCQPSQSPYLPSWVIDFSANAIHTSNEHSVDEQMLYYANFDACASSEVQCGIITTLQTLSTAAFLYDEIEELSRCVTPFGPQTQSPEEIFVSWVELYRRFGDDLSLLDFSRTVCAGLALKNKQFAPEDACLFWDSIIGVALELPKRPASKAEDDALDDWNRWISKVALSKRFFVTKGRRMGLASNAAAVGDHIAIFASGRLPFVVRKVCADTNSDAYILRGTCYLDGIMHGEAVYERGERTYKEPRQADDGCPSLERRRFLDALIPLRDHEQNGARAEDLSAGERYHMLKRTRSLDSGKLAKAFAVRLAFKDDLYLV